MDNNSFGTRTNEQTTRLQLPINANHVVGSKGKARKKKRKQVLINEGLVNETHDGQYEHGPQVHEATRQRPRQAVGNAAETEELKPAKEAKEQKSLFAQMKANPRAFNLKKILDSVEVRAPQASRPKLMKTQQSKQKEQAEAKTAGRAQALPKIKHMSHYGHPLRPDQATKPTANQTGVGGYQIPPIELRGQYRNQLKGSYVRRGMSKATLLNDMPAKAQQTLRGSFGTFGQAKRDLAPLEEQQESAWQRTSAQAAGGHLQVNEGKHPQARRNMQRMLESLDSGLVKLGRRNEAWQWQIGERYESAAPEEMRASAAGEGEWRDGYYPVSNKSRLGPTAEGPTALGRKLPPLLQSTVAQSLLQTKGGGESVLENQGRFVEWFGKGHDFAQDYTGQLAQQDGQGHSFSGPECDLSVVESENYSKRARNEVEERHRQEEVSVERQVSLVNDGEGRRREAIPESRFPQEERRDFTRMDPSIGTQDTLTHGRPGGLNPGGNNVGEVALKTNEGQPGEVSLENAAFVLEGLEQARRETYGDELDQRRATMVSRGMAEDVTPDPQRKEAPALVVGGYRVGGLEVEPQWALPPKRGQAKRDLPTAAAKEMKVLPQLSKSSISRATDVTLVLGSTKAPRPRPKNLLVVLFEGVLATYDREQNLQDTEADFYEDTEEEDDSEDDTDEDEGGENKSINKDSAVRRQEDPRVKGSAVEHNQRIHAEVDGKASGTDIRSEGGADKRKSKQKARNEAGSNASGSFTAGYRNQPPALEVIREESARAGSPQAQQMLLGKVEKARKKATLSRKATKKKMLQTVVFEESQQASPLWMNRDEKAILRQPAPGHCLYFRHGIARGLTNLKQQFFIVILLQRKSSSQRRKQIMKALEEQDLYFDAIYQHNSLFNGDSQGDSMGGSRFFSIDRIVNDSGYTPAQTVFLTSVDQSQYNYDINEYLEKEVMPPKFEPRPRDFGLLPLPYTVSRLEKDTRAGSSNLKGFQLDLHKLVVIGVPHVLQNNDQPSMNKTKAMSFKHIYRMIKNFNQLCLSFENGPSPAQRSSSPLPEGKESQSDSEASLDSEESSSDLGSIKYFVKEKYRRIFDPQKQAEMREAEVNTIEDGANLDKIKKQNSKEEVNEPQTQPDPPEEAAQEQRDEPQATKKQGFEESSFDDDDSSDSMSGKKLIKEPKVFYKGFKKAREHGLFSLMYQSFPLLAQAALAERFMNYLLKYRSKITKIDGLAQRLVRLKEKQAAEDKEAGMATTYPQPSSTKDHAQRYCYEALRRQPGLQASIQHLKAYYKEVYDECVLTHTKFSGQPSSKEAGQPSQIQSQSNQATTLQPSLDQLRRLRFAYAYEVAGIEKLLRDSETDFHKSYSIMSLSGQLYTAKRMTNYGPSSEFNFKARLVVGGQQPPPGKETRELPANLEDDERPSGEQESLLEPRRGSASNPQNGGIFSSADGKKITNMRNQIPVEQVRSILDWLSKKAPLHQVQYQQI